MIDLPPVKEFLKSLEGNAVFFDPLFGNSGDQMIRVGAEHLLDELSVKRVSDPKKAGCILLNGGGGMAEGWSGLQMVNKYCRDYPDTPLAILPQSYLFHQPDPGRWFRKRRAPLWLWARELPSLEILRNLTFDCETRIGIDHDLAFEMSGLPLLEKLRAIEPDPVLLAVERDDWEGPTGRRRPLSFDGLMFIPESWRNSVRRALLGRLRMRHDRTSRFGQAALDLLPELGLEDAGLTLRSKDISLGEACTFEEFLSAVATARVIVSTRLHVAILGHMLGRETVLVEGTYHKAGGVFAYSMQGGSCRLAVWRDGALHLRD